ncbi:gamma-glutamyltransferase [Actinoplanes italicus]|uniref:Gamma-glutamyltranspeptidase/glutathione hydrolase n=1 Tax=Actinoplanes italicus TaxID=113567 RepID=A0A2T0KQD6_9ACTN|nr:gamma-glutamyltransferase [Actinoplanes italicus]PRX25958.1 gamma-glutamyltranspeptidase/glutathione hydrolase [Actinoplanes italicus]GIE33542.1 gamma-glutamyltransferase [Actinoplanes italicus]
MKSVAAGVAASHPATARTGLRILQAGGTAADAAVGAVLACCVAETVYTGLGGGGFATYFDAGTREVTCLDFFVAVPGLDGDRKPAPMVSVDVFFGGLPQVYSIGGASVAVPGVPAGLGEVHRRWGRLPWPQVVAPAAGLARTGVLLPVAHARTLESCAPALAYGDGAGPYQPGGRLLQGDELLYHPGLAAAMDTLAEEGPSVFYTGAYGKLLVDTVRAAGGTIGPVDLRSYRVESVPVDQAPLAGYRVHARHDLNRTVDTIGGLPTELARPVRAPGVASALLNRGQQRLGDTTNVSVVDSEGNACVITTTLGLGSGVWLPGLGINLNSMLGEGELLTDDLVPGQRMSSYMCPLVVTAPDGGLAVAAGSAGASRIRTALVDTLLGVIVDGLSVPEAIARPRFHVVEDTVHAEPGYPPAELAELAAAGWQIVEWPEITHYFGGVTAVGRAGAAGDPRRGGVGLLL